MWGTCLLVQCNTGDVGSIPVLGTKTPHVWEQLSPGASATEPKGSRACRTHLESLRTDKIKYINKSLKKLYNEEIVLFCFLNKPMSEVK